MIFVGSNRAVKRTASKRKNPGKLPTFKIDFQKPQPQPTRKRRNPVGKSTFNNDDDLIEV